MRGDIFSRFAKVEPIAGGRSEDREYGVTAADGAKYLLRISPAGRYEERRALFGLLGRAAALGVPTGRPVEFGLCGEGVYLLLSRVGGEEAETALPLLTETGQYVLGLRAGEVLRRIHSIPAPEMREDWAARFGRDADEKIREYRACGLRFPGDETLIAYLESNRSLLKGRPQCFRHGDYHVGNMRVENGALRVTGFDRADFGDPWEEFGRIARSAAASPWFATGQLRGYFGGEPPRAFFRLLVLYIAGDALSSVCRAFPPGQSGADAAAARAQAVLSWFDGMRSPVPSWYLGDFYIQWVDSVPLKLRAPFDFSFLGRYGKVFRVFDDQDSGNLCFGVRDGGRRYFVKFAGAPAQRYDGRPEDAVARLKAAVPVYRDLAHPGLIRLIRAEEIGRAGYAAVFEWTDAECMGRQYPRSHRRFMSLPLAARERIYREILAFHIHAAGRGYVAVDFYDGSILYDFAARKTVICDVDLYQKIPYYGGEVVWGSERFLAPEERVRGALRDGVTTVYTMGATAFALFAESDRSFEKWPLGRERYEAVKRAVSDDRRLRQQSVRELAEEWEKAEPAGGARRPQEENRS